MELTRRLNVNVKPLVLLSAKYRNKNIDAIMNYIMHYNTDWFAFLEYGGVEPTTNRVERGLRHVVIKGKVSQQTN